MTAPVSRPESFAAALHAAAHRQPSQTALLHGDQCWTFAAWLEEVATLGARLPDAPELIAQAGDSLTLARYAAAAAFRFRPFFPLPRTTGAPDGAGPITASAVALPEAISANAALLISTSGSEGKPRLVVLSQLQLLAAAHAANARLDLSPGALWLHCMPLEHIGGQSILWRCTLAGAGICLHERFRVDTVAADLDRWPITHISLVPAMLARLLDAGIAPPPSLRVALIGGAALSAPLHARATAAGWPLYVSYGMSETAAMLAVHTPNDGPWTPGCVGYLLAGHEIALTTKGRIRLRGPQVMHGYLDGSGIDADGWLTTGDLGHVDADGRLHVLGRADDMLISGGSNVHPQAVESCLAACPGISDVAVTGFADPVWGDRVVALIVGSATPSAAEAHARRHLPAAAVPREIRQVSHLPRNPAGKIDRPALRQLAISVLSA